MVTSMVVFGIAAVALAVGLAYSASPKQRWLRAPLPAFPTRVSALLAAIVGLKALSEAWRYFL